MTRAYLDKQDLNALLEVGYCYGKYVLTRTIIQCGLQEIKKLETLDELEGFLLKHGENIVDMMGGEIDRMELKLRVIINFII